MPNPELLKSAKEHMMSYVYFNYCLIVFSIFTMYFVKYESHDLDVYLLDLSPFIIIILIHLLTTIFAHFEVKDNDLTLVNITTLEDGRMVLRTRSNQEPKTFYYNKYAGNEYAMFVFAYFSIYTYFYVIFLVNVLDFKQIDSESSYVFSLYVIFGAYLCVLLLVNYLEKRLFRWDRMRQNNQTQTGQNQDENSQNVPI